MRRLAPVVVSLLSSTSATSAFGQVLHERVAVGSLRCEGGVCWTEDRRRNAPAPAPVGPNDASQSKLPVAIQVDGQTLFAPNDPPTPQPGEQIYGPEPERQPDASSGGRVPLTGDPPPERRAMVRADRDTGPEPPGQHFYHEVFNPATFPFKRMSALDSVRAVPCSPPRPGCTEEILEVHDPARHRMRIAGVDRQSGSEAFWGSAMFDFEPGKWVPLPSVAPEQRILSYAADPRADVTFARDQADNWFVSSASGGRRRLTWLVDAPASYFAGELPPGVRLADEPKDLARPIPPDLRVQVQRVLEKAKVHIDADATLESVLFPLVEYFRSFQPGKLPESSSSLYLDLALGQTGSCRHRSYAFAVTAMALGIPTRYVENELHVFVEVYVPRMGWRRINLGGATLEDEVLSGNGKIPHVPKGGDPFPQPDAYRKSASPPPRGLAAPAPRHSGSESAMSEAGGPARVDLDALAKSDGTADPRSAPARARTSVTVEIGDANAYRGDTIEVRGVVSAVGGGDAAALTVQVYLESAGGAVRLGETVTDGGGRFKATLEVPRELPLGDHKVVVRTPGDARRGPSMSKRK
jgi:hypothetical protein